MSQVDELFGGGAGTRARVPLVVTLLGSGGLLTLLGLGCTTLPGGLLVLAGWLVSEKELERVEAGFLPIDQRRVLRALRGVAVLLVLLATVAFAVQLVLLQSGFYGVLWETWLNAWFGIEAP